MIDLNLANFITVGLIAVASWALVQWLMQTFNISLPFMKN